MILQRKEDGSFFFLPLPTQQELFDVPDSIFEVFFGGAVGGGKTDAIIAFPIVRRWHENSNFKGLILRPTCPQLEKEIVPRTRDLYAKFGGKYNSTFHRWTFPSGAVLQLGYATTRVMAEDFDGAEYQYVAFDELQQFPREVYSYIPVSYTHLTLPTILLV